MTQSFSPVFADLVRNAASVEGSGPATLGPPAAGCRDLATAVQPGGQFYYCLEGSGASAQREVGRGTLLEGGTVARDPVDGEPVDFDAGPKTISLVAAAEWYSKVEQQVAAPDLAIDGRLDVAGGISVGGQAQFANVVARGLQYSFGAVGGTPGDCEFSFENSNYYNIVDFRSWRDGVPFSSGSLISHHGFGLYLTGNAHIVFRSSGSEVARIGPDGFRATAGALGYGAGTGGAVAQQGGPASPVELDRHCGRISLDASGLAPDGCAFFHFGNSRIAASDLILLNLASGAADEVSIDVVAVEAGSCRLRVRNGGNGPLAGPLGLNFALLKAEHV
jgi:hypothetical protein